MLLYFRYCYDNVKCYSLKQTKKSLFGILEVFLLWRQIGMRCEFLMGTECLSESLPCRQVGQDKSGGCLYLIQPLGRSLLCQWMDRMLVMMKVLCRQYYERLYLSCFLTAETIKSCDTPCALHPPLSRCADCSLRNLLNSCLSLKRICQCVHGDKGVSVTARIIVWGSIQNCFHESQTLG